MMIDAVLILPLEDFHRFDCNLVLKLRFFDSCRLKYCFKRRIKRKEPYFLFGFFDWYGSNWKKKIKPFF